LNKNFEIGPAGVTWQKVVLFPVSNYIAKGDGIKLHTFLTLALDSGEWSLLLYSPFIPGECAPNWIGVWVGPTVFPDVVVKRKVLPLQGIKHWLCSL